MAVVQRLDGTVAVDAWTEVRAVIDGPLAEIASRLSRLLQVRRPHEALVIFTRECTGRPRKVTGRRDLVDRVTIAELEVVRDVLPLGGVLDRSMTLAGAPRRIWAMRDPADTLLVLVPRNDQVAAPVWDELAGIFGIVATSIRQQVVQASPDYLAESRAASSERARTIVEFSEVHEATLTSILGTLRSGDLDDRRARLTASETASAALIALRAAGAADRAFSEEAVTTAFARLQGELRPLLRDRGIDVEYAEPPADGRPLPGEIANAARAMVRTIVMAFTAEEEISRIRVAWDCDGENVLIEVRDQGAGAVDRSALMSQLTGRLRALHGELDIESVAGWGNRLTLSLPLDPPAARPDEHLLSTLNPRELEVLGHLAVGRRNKAIGDLLGISQSTVKFHVASVLRKLEVANRSEAGAMAIKAGIAAPVPH